MLELINVNGYYGDAHILQNVSLHVKKGEIVTLIGRNGAGKTTTLKAIMGLVKAKGKIIFNGQSLENQPIHARFHQGLAYVPEERRIVPGLTVEENLRLGILASVKRNEEKQRIEKIAETFPRLKQRLKQEAITMSGGEQQMLAIARAMMSEPQMVLLDEPSEGIMPILVQEMFQEFQNMQKQGITILLVEQNVELAFQLAQRVYILDQGQVVFTDSAENLRNNKDIQEKYCAV